MTFHDTYCAAESCICGTDGTDITIEGFGPYTVTFEGKTAWLGGTDVSSPEALRAAAIDKEARAERLLFDARRARAMANVFERWQRAEAQRKAAQRRQRAAATRARNKDPFGFGRSI